MGIDELKMTMPAYQRGIHLTVNDTSRFEGSGTGVGVGIGTNGPGVGIGVGGVNGNIISKKEMDFYSGLKFSDVTDEKFKLMFRDLDCIEPYGELSAEEIEQYLKYNQQKTEYDKKENIAKLLGGAGMLTVGLASYCGLGCISRKGKIAAIGFAIAGLAALIKGVLISNANCAKYQDVEMLNDQYKHISKAELSK